jgi:YfiH family protein
VAGQHDHETAARIVAGRRALERRDRAATVLFGLGPPLKHAFSPAQQLAAILDDLSPELRAVRWALQVHGRDLVLVTGASHDPVRCVGEADGLLTSVAGFGLVVWTADCVPIALVGPRSVAMVHAGWRGAAAGVATEALHRLAADTAAPPAELTAILGPSIGGPHYQVGAEVVDALRRTGVPESAWLAGDRVDLRGFLKAQLESLGVNRVETLGPCTFGTPTLASFRRDGAGAGRQWSLVWR